MNQRGLPTTAPRGGDRFRRAAPWALALLLALGWHVMMAVKRQTEFGTAWLVGLDDNFYLAWGRSLAVDGDWNFDNDVAFAASLTSLPDTARAFQSWIRDSQRTNVGRVSNKYPVGTGLLALPWLLAARLGLELVAFTGYTGPPEPFSALYAFAFAASGVFWGFVGLATARALLRRDYSSRVATLAVIVGAIGLPLGYYVWIEPTMAHATGFGVATLHVLCARTWAEQVRANAPAWGRGALLTGLTLGVACLIRSTNLVLAAVPLVMVWAARSSTPVRWTVVARSGGLVALGAVIGFLPQMIAWKVVYGTFLVNSYAFEALTVWPHETQSVWPRYLALVLFGPRNGLFSWTPVALVAVIGLAWGIRERTLCRSGVIVLAATAWIYGGWQTYWLGHGFGMRGFVDVSFFLLLGLAEVITRAEHLRASTRRVGGIVLVLCLVWTIHLTVCYRAAIQPHGEPLALRPVMTEWRRWARQVYNDTGVKMLVRHVRGAW